MIKKGAWCFSNGYSTCSRLQARSQLSTSDRHRLDSLYLRKPKYYCKAMGGFQLHFQFTKSNSEAYLSRESHSPATQTHKKSEYPVAGQEISSDCKRGRNTSQEIFPRSFTALISVGVHQGVPRTSFSNISPGQHLQDTTTEPSPLTSHKSSLQRTARE